MRLNPWRGVSAAVDPSLRPNTRRPIAAHRWKAAAIVFALACSGDRLLAPSPAVVGGAANLSAGPTIRISEFHYDNSGTDTGEAIEISGPADADLTGWRIVRYNGAAPASGVVYTTPAGPTIGGTIPKSCGTRGVLVFTYPVDGLQNGGNDGFALVNPSNVVVEFLSYEGVMTVPGTATVANPAAGTTSVDVGVSEPGNATGTSIQRKPDGTWILSATQSFGTCNDDDSGGTTAVVVASVTVAPLTASVATGASQQFTATASDGATPPNPVTAILTWSSDREDIATVNNTGLATAGLVTGTATITAKAANGVSGSAQLTVTVPPVVDLVISQVYGGGGNGGVGGSTFLNDYVELFNRGADPVNLSGWAVQYAAATGTSWQSTPLTGTIQPGHYFLIQEDAGAGPAPALPTPDVSTGTIGMAAGAGKVILTRPGVIVSGACPTGSGIVDRVAFGTTANCTDPAAWGGTTGNLGNTTAAIRNDAGCANTGNLSADFAVGTPTPRNSATDPHVCPPPPGPLDHVVVTGGTTVSIGSTVKLTAELQDAANQKITDAAATYSWVSGDDATVHLVSTTGNTATFKGMQLGGPITLTVSATSKGLTKGAAPVPTMTVNGVATIVPSTTVVSEIHYDNTGGDVGEAFEFEGDAGTSLTGWSLILYDGNGGAVYNTTPLTGIFPATCGARGVLVVNFPNTEFGTVQNGASQTNTNGDGWALVNADGQITEFKSYEGTFTATGGPAGGLTSTAIDADESTAPPSSPRRSVQRAENGVWFGPALDTFGACNAAVPPASQGSITLAGGKTELALGLQTQFFFGGVDKSGHTVTSVVYSTSNTAIITVDQKGFVTAKGLGSAKLIATALDDATGSIDIAVYQPEGSATARMGHNTEFGEPTDANPDDEVIIKRAQYTVSYSPARGGANWVSWNLDASHLGDNGRCSGTCYSSDTSLVKAGITAYTTADWISGNTYDRGHMAPSADWTSSESDNNATFFLSNFLPQRHELNAGPWEVLENALRDSVSTSHGSREAYIIAGGIFTNGVGLGTVLGLGKIAIPDSTWKIAVITPAGLGLNAGGTLPPNTTVMAVNMPNVTNPSSDWHTYLTSVAKIERSTGYNFLSLLEASLQCRVEGNCAPTARITSDLTDGSTIFGKPATFSGSTSTDPDEGDALSMTWKVDGSAAGTGPTFHYTFATAGTYHVRLTVTDNGGLTNTVETTVTVNPRPAPTCGPGKFENAADLYACDPAPAGSYVAVSDATSPTQCAQGYYQPLPGQDSCLPAPQGHYVAGIGAIAAAECAIGSYQDVTGASECKLASPGHFVASPGAVTASECPVGKYQDLAGQPSCKPSLPGSYVSTTGATTSTPCDAGAYQPASGATSCLPSPAGSYVPGSGAASATPCAVGSYQPADGQTTCIPAPQGRFVAMPGASAAEPCAVGTYQNLTGQAGCQLAPAGYYVGTVGAATATPCPLGQFQNGVGAFECKNALPGTYVGLPAATEPSLCPLGTYQDMTAASSCKPSPAGSYVATTGAASPTPCAVGTYQPNLGATSCIPSPAGSYVATAGAASPTPCSLGSYQNNVGATSCIPAPIGSYVDLIGATSATACPVGMTTNAAGTTSLSGCVWLPAAALTQLVVDQLQQMVTAGQISAADAKPISESIDQALKSIAKGNLTPARNQLGAARNKVEAAVNSGKITATNAAALLALIDMAIAHM